MTVLFSFWWCSVFFFCCPCYTQYSMLIFQYCWICVGHCTCTLRIHHIIFPFFAYARSVTVRPFRRILHTKMCMLLFAKLVRLQSFALGSPDPSVCLTGGTRRLSLGGRTLLCKINLDRPSDKNITRRDRSFLCEIDTFPP
jgi:hypothetical protein